MPLIDVEPNSDEWRKARLGSLGASQVADAVAKIKTGYGASRANVMAGLIAERLTGVPTEGYTNAAMQHGLATEPEALAAYAFYQGVTVERVGLFTHPRIVGSHASPDGAVSKDGLAEVKCPNTATHIETLLSESIPGKYVLQMQWQMACADRQWCDFISYDPRLPEEMRLFIRRVPRDNGKIAELEGEVKGFLQELAEKEAALRAKFQG